MRLKYYADMKDAPLSDLLRQARINNENQLMAFHDSSWLDCPYTGRSTGAFILYSLKVLQFTMAHMFQEQLLNQVQKMSTMQHVLQ